MLFDLWRFALMNLFRSKWRLVVTASGVVIGTSAVILLVALTIGLQANAEAGLGSNTSLTEIRVFPNVQTLEFDPNVKLISLASLEEIRALEGIADVIPMLPLVANAELRVGRYTKSVRVFGIAPEQITARGLTVLSGDLASLTENSLIIGADVSRSFVDPRGESWIPVSVDFTANSLAFVLNNFDETDQIRLNFEPSIIVSSENYDFNHAVFLPLEQVMSLNTWVTGEALPPEEIFFDEILVRSTGREATLQVVAELESIGYGAESLGAFLDEINNFFNLMRLVLGGLGFLALLIAAFGLANTMMMAIIERTHEIGLLKAIGARDSDILLLFLMEAAMLGFFGGLMGLGIALTVQTGLNRAVVGLSPEHPIALFLELGQMQGDLLVIPRDLLLFALALATALSFLAGLFPAWRAAQLSPVLALKEE